MAICRNFCGRNCGFWGRGGRKKFGPHQKHPKVFSKKFWVRGPYLGALWARKSQKMAILGQKSHISEISVAGNRGGRGGRSENFWIWTTKLHKFLQKKIRGPNSIWNLRSENSRGAKKGVFLPSPERFRRGFGGEIFGMLRDLLPHQKRPYFGTSTWETQPLLELKMPFWGPTGPKTMS